MWDVGAGLPRLVNDGTARYVYGPGGLLLEQVQGSTAYYPVPAPAEARPAHTRSAPSRRSPAAAAPPPRPTFTPCPPPARSCPSAVILRVSIAQWFAPNVCQ